MKLNNRQEIWKYLQEYFTDEILKKCNFGTNINKKEIMQEIARLLLEYEVSGELKLNLTQKDRAIESKILNDIIDRNIREEIRDDIEKLKNALEKTCEETFYSMSYILGLGISFDIQQITAKQMKNIIDTIIQGKKYSDRIYDNKNAVAKTIKLEIKKLLDGNTDINSVKEIIEKRYNVDKHISQRLIQNEISRCQVATNSLWQEEHKKYIGKLMWSATLENNTCEQCGELDGETWDVDEEHPEPVEDTHPLCRCCLIALPDEDWRPPTRLDNETKENINWETYEEWKENNE